MLSNKSFKVTARLLLFLPLLLMGWKISQGYLIGKNLIPEVLFQVEMNYAIEGAKGEELFVKSYLPKDNIHQKISRVSVATDELEFATRNIEGVGKKGEWRGVPTSAQRISCEFQYKGRAMRYEISDGMPLESELPDDMDAYLMSEEFIQSDDLMIQKLANELTEGKADLKSTVEAIYRYVALMPAIKTSELTDAISAMRNHKASCNGKSRLLVALCRAKGIPARVVGGIILDHGEKRTSHLWTEVWMGNEWVPFDALNNHFAYLPANYMQLYNGDYFLIARTPDVKFDYSFSIEKEKYFTAHKAGAFTLWSLLSDENISIGLLKVILLLPLCSLLVGVFKNVIGLKTIGVFLPAIIAVSLDSIGPTFGLLAFLMVVGVVALLHFPLEKWGVLYAPKLIIMLTGVVVSLLLFAKVGMLCGITIFSSMIFFPIIVLTIAAEKFARTIVEEGFFDALKLQAQTLLLTFICYLVFAPEFLVGYFLTFPETYLIIVGVLLLLGRWIGLRMTEYIRFGGLEKAI